jgi:hypothetical protein
MNLGARYGQHDSPNHPSRRIGSVRWWLVRPGALVLVQRLGRVGRPPQLAASSFPPARRFALHENLQVILQVLIALSG